MDKLTEAILDFRTARRHANNLCGGLWRRTGDKWALMPFRLLDKHEGKALIPDHQRMTHEDINND